MFFKTMTVQLEHINRLLQLFKNIFYHAVIMLNSFSIHCNLIPLKHKYNRVTESVMLQVRMCVLINTMHVCVGVYIDYVTHIRT